MQSTASKVKAPAPARANQRRAHRHRSGAQVSWRVLGRDSAFSTGELKDISTGGLALVVDRSCKPGTVVVVVQLHGGATAEPMLLRAEWAKQQSDSAWLLGCSFTSPLTEKETQAFLVAAQKAAQQRPQTPTEKAQTFDPFVVGSVKERRGAPRRGGLSIPVLVWRSEGGPRLQGAVADRSLTGLGILMRAPFASGTQLTVRPASADEKTPSVKVQVRTCRQKGTQWLVGCQFIQSPPTNILLLFG